MMIERQVISKPEQIKKREPNRKKTMMETLMDSVSRIEKVQQEQRNYIERLFSQQQVSFQCLRHPIILTEQQQMVTLRDDRSSGKSEDTSMESNNNNNNGQAIRWERRFHSPLQSTGSDDDPMENSIVSDPLFKRHMT